MRPEDISLGKQMTFRGAGVSPAPDGGILLTLHIELDESRAIDLPITLSAKDRDGLVSQMLAYQQRS